MNPAGDECGADQILADRRVLLGWQQAPVRVVQLAPRNGQVVIIGRPDPVHLIDVRPLVVEAEQAEPADDPQQQQRHHQDLDDPPLPSRSSIVHGDILTKTSPRAHRIREERLDRVGLREGTLTDMSPSQSVS